MIRYVFLLSYESRVSSARAFIQAVFLLGNMLKLFLDFQATDHVVVDLLASRDSEQETVSQDDDANAIHVDHDTLRSEYYFFNAHIYVHNTVLN